LLQAFGDELRFLLIVSEATVVGDGEPPEDAHLTADFAIWVRNSEAPKCVRCWHHRADVGSDPAHPELCGRCVENVEGPGEVRRMA
jgi:isoleucyl-tRNA synthetase